MLGLPTHAKVPDDMVSLRIDDIHAVTAAVRHIDQRWKLTNHGTEIAGRVGRVDIALIQDRRHARQSRYRAYPGQAACPAADPRVGQRRIRRRAPRWHYKRVSKISWRYGCGSNRAQRFRNRFGRLLSHADAIRYADARIGIAGQLKAGNGGGPRFDFGEPRRVTDRVLRHGAGPAEDAREGWRRA